MNLKWADIQSKLLYAVVVAVFLFIWNVHSRLTTLEAHSSLVQRVEGLENALQPVLIEYNLQARLREMGIDPFAETSAPVVEVSPVMSDDDEFPAVTKPALRELLLPEAKRKSMEQLQYRKGD